MAKAVKGGVLRAVKKVRGGVKVAHHKNTAELEVVRIPTPSKVVIPMQQHIGAPCEPVVKVGDEVAVGQLIGDSDKFVSAPIHASVSGTVTAIGDIKMPNGSVSKAVTIESDGEMRLWEGIKPPKVETREDLIKAVRDSGLVGLGGAGFPTHVKLNFPPDKNIDTLVVNAAECEPYCTADQRLLADRGDLVLQGALALGQAIRAKRVVLAAQGDQIKTVEKLERWLLKKKISVEVVLLRSHYPLGEEKQIVRAITGREVPPGGAPVDVKCLVLNAATVYAVSEAMLRGRPLTHRAVTVSGRGVVRPRNLWVPIGTPLRDLIQSAGGMREEKALFLVGGPMRGVEQKDLNAPVLPDTNSLVCMLPEERAVSSPQTPCVRCGRCAAACPMRLVPAFVVKAFRLNDMGRLKGLHLQDCLQCGCCTYICPSQIPLMDLMRKARTIVEGGDRA